MAVSEGTQSVARALNLLRSVSAAGDIGARLVDVTKACGLNTTTAHRLLRHLVAENFLTYEPSRKLYHVGPEIFRMAHHEGGGALRRRMRPALERVADRTGRAAYLSVRSGSEGVCIDRVLGPSDVDVVPYKVGSRRILGVGAAGIALLGTLPEADRDTILAAKAEVYSGYALDGAEIRRIIAEGRRNGFVYNPGLFLRGISGLSIPITVGDVGVAALSVVGLSSGFESAAERRRVAAILEAEAESVDAAPVWRRNAAAGASD